MCLLTAKKTTNFLKTLAFWWKRLTWFDITVDKFTIECIIFGFQGSIQNTKLINYCILYAKHFIYKTKWITLISLAGGTLPYVKVTLPGGDTPICEDHNAGRGDTPIHEGHIARGGHSNTWRSHCPAGHSHMWRSQCPGRHSHTWRSRCPGGHSHMWRSCCMGDTPICYFRKS